MSVIWFLLSLHTLMHIISGGLKFVFIIHFHSTIWILSAKIWPYRVLVGWLVSHNDNNCALPNPRCATMASSRLWAISWSWRWHSQVAGSYSICEMKWNYNNLLFVERFTYWLIDYTDMMTLKCWLIDGVIGDYCEPLCTVSIQRGSIHLQHLRSWAQCQRQRKPSALHR